MPNIRKGDIVTYHYKNSLINSGILYGFKGHIMEVVKRESPYVWVRTEGSESDGVPTRLSYVTFHSRPKKK